MPEWLPFTLAPRSTSISLHSSSQTGAACRMVLLLATEAVARSPTAAQMRALPARLPAACADGRRCPACLLAFCRPAPDCAVPHTLRLRPARPLQAAPASALRLGTPEAMPLPVLQLVVPAAVAAACCLGSALLQGARRRRQTRRQEAVRADWRAESDLSFAAAKKGAMLDLAQLNSSDPAAFYVPPQSAAPPDCCATVDGVRLPLDSGPLAKECDILQDIIKAFNDGELASSSVRGGRSSSRVEAQPARQSIDGRCMLGKRCMRRLILLSPRCLQLLRWPSHCSQFTTCNPCTPGLPTAVGPRPVPHVQGRHLAGGCLPDVAGAQAQQQGRPCQPGDLGSGRAAAGRGTAGALPGLPPAAENHRQVPRG